VSVAHRDTAKVLAQAKILGVPAAQIGTVGGNSFSIKTEVGNLECALSELHDLWWNAIAVAMA
jgi:hypothetical protein